MQNAAASMARLLAQVAESAVGFINQDQSIRICHNARTVETVHVPKLIHNDTPTGLLSATTSPDDSCLRNFRASTRVS